MLNQFKEALTPVVVLFFLAKGRCVESAPRLALLVYARRGLVVAVSPSLAGVTASFLAGAAGAFEAEGAARACVVVLGPPESGIPWRRVHIR